MEQSGYWMWEKRKHSMSSLGSTNNPSYDDSWEEQAFAEDTAGILGGCVWPPRSYSCSFCRREFRSAQALGGHMNVHRRDRARLKQSPCSQDEIRHHDDFQIHQSSVHNPFASLSYLYPSKVCGLAFSINPNSDPTVVVSPSSEPSAVSAPPTAEIFCADKLFPPYNYSMVRENHKYPVCNYSPKSLSPLVEEKNVYSDDKFNSKNDCQKVSKILNAGRRAQDDDYLKTDLSVSLNLVVCRAQPALEYETREKTIGCKRKRTDSTIPLFLNSTSVERHQTHQKVFEISPNPIDELDLELRLGVDRPQS